MNMKWIFFLSLILTVSCKETTHSSHAHAEASPSKFLKHHQHSHVNSKVRSYYQVDIKRLVSGSGEVLLQANVMARSPQTDTHVEWQLPRDLSPVEGSLQEIYDAEAGVTRQFQILISEDQLQEKDQIFVFVYHLEENTRHGLSQSYVYTTKEKDEVAPQSLDKSKKSPRFLQ